VCGEAREGEGVEVTKGGGEEIGLARRERKKRNFRIVFPEKGSEDRGEGENKVCSC
jgi:hypothetical protein